MKKNNLIIVFFIFLIVLLFVKIIMQKSENKNENLYEINTIIEETNLISTELLSEQTTAFIFETTSLAYEEEKKLAENIIDNDIKYGEPIEIENLNTTAYKKLEEEVFQITSEDEKSINEINIQKINYYFNYENDSNLNNDDMETFYPALNINCPEIRGLANNNIENKINNELKNIAFIKLFNNNEYFDYVGYNELLNNYKLYRNDFKNNIVKGHEEYNLYLNVNVDYKINILDNRFLSVMFDNNIAVNNNKLVYKISLATFDLKNGKRIYLDEYVKVEDILKAIYNKDFENYYGAEYRPNGISKNVQAMVFPQRIEKMLYKEKEKCYDKYCTNNFYIDDKNIYIKFYFTRNYSLDGMVVLKLNKSLA